MDQLDAGLRALAVGILAALSLSGYPAAPPTGLAGAISPALVAAGLIGYNAAVVLLLGVPWRRRPGFGHGIKLPRPARRLNMLVDRRIALGARRIENDPRRRG